MVNEVIHKSLVFSNKEDSLVSVSEGKYVVLCTWNTEYGWYYYEFKKLQSVYDKYKNSEKVAFYIVGYNMDNRNQLQDSHERMENEFKIDIPYLIVKDAHSFIHYTNISKNYCNVLILKGNKLIFRGDIAHTEQILPQLLLTSKV